MKQQQQDYQARRRPVAGVKRDSEGTSIQSPLLLPQSQLQQRLLTYPILLQRVLLAPHPRFYVVMVVMVAEVLIKLR